MIRWATLSLFVLLVGCNDPPLASRSKVVSPRVLAIVAEPPEVLPGESVRLSVLTAGLTETPTFQWTVCARPEASTTFTANSSFGQAEPDEGCFSERATNVFSLGTTEEVTLPVPGNLLEQLAALRAVYGASLSEASLRRIAQVAGLPFTVSLEMRHGNTVVRAIKRVVVTTRTTTNSNPPAPTLRFGVSDAGMGGTMLAGSSSNPTQCLPENGEMLTVRRGEKVELAPTPTEDAWLQGYDSLDSSGGVTPLRETAFYSFYMTDGWLTEERTRIPTRNTIWTAPDRARRVDFWLVVRDGRGGTSHCTFPVMVR